jgi:hypothetical protein
MNDAVGEIERLRTELARMSSEVERLRAEVGRVGGDHHSEDSEPRQRRVARRDALRLAGAAAVGLAASSAASPSAAVAIAPTNPIEGGGKTVTTASTELDYDSSTAPAHHVLWVQDGIRKFGYPEPAFPHAAAISGWSGLWTQDGVQGVTETSGFGGNFEGRGDAPAVGTGLRAKGRRSTMLLVPAPSASIAAFLDRTPGEVLIDNNFDVWCCVKAGNPGEWRKLSGPDSAGSFHAIDPVRAYDSRAAIPQQGPLVSGQSRTVAARNSRDLDTGQILVADVVPIGATAVAYNLTIANTTGQGFVCANRGGIDTVSSAAIVWSGSGQLLSNALVTKLDSARQLTLICGGGGSTHVIIDLLGYYR